MSNLKVGCEVIAQKYMNETTGGFVDWYKHTCMHEQEKIKSSSNNPRGLFSFLSHSDWADLSEYLLSFLAHEYPYDAN